jgi:hypothetical protein
VVTGKVTHSVDADGAHIITIRVPEILIDPDSVPTKPSRGGKVPIGPSTPDISRGSKR